MGSPPPSKTKAPGQEGRQLGSECGQAPGHLQVDQTSLWPLLPLHKGVLGVRDTGVRASKCPTLTDPSWQIGPSAQQHPITWGGQASRTSGGAPYPVALGTGPPGAGCWQDSEATPRPVQEEGGPVFSDAPQPRRAGWQPPAARARPPSCLSACSSGLGEAGPACCPRGHRFPGATDTGLGVGLRDLRTWPASRTHRWGPQGPAHAQVMAVPSQEEPGSRGSGPAAPRRLSEGVPVGGDQPG